MKYQLYPNSRKIDAFSKKHAFVAKLITDIMSNEVKYALVILKAGQTICICRY